MPIAREVVDMFWMWFAAGVLVGGAAIWLLLSRQALRQLAYLREENAEVKLALETERRNGEHTRDHLYGDVPRVPEAIN